jgi:hypothetical protein
MKSTTLFRKDISFWSKIPFAIVGRGEGKNVFRRQIGKPDPFFFPWGGRSIDKEKRNLGY